MTENHPITPSPELVQAFLRSNPFTPAEMTYEQFIATRFARWGADQELEACCEWFFKNYAVPSSQLRAIRRPKPPSLKELALETFNKLEHLFDGYGYDGPTIRRALESLPD